MTTLSKEDILSLALSYHLIEGPHYDFLNKNLMSFVTDVRADLVAENERLKDAQFKRLEREAEKRMELRTALAAAELELSACVLDKMEQAKQLVAAEADISSIERLVADNTIVLAAVLEAHPGGRCAAKQIEYNNDRLSRPRDDSALREMIAGVYEECAKECDKRESIEREKAKKAREQRNIAAAIDYDQNADQAMLMAQDIRALAEKHKDNK